MVYSDPDSPADPQGLGTTTVKVPSLIHTDPEQRFSKLGSLDHHISILWENNGNVLLRLHPRLTESKDLQERGPALCFNKPSLMLFQV